MGLADQPNLSEQRTRSAPSAPSKGWRPGLVSPTQRALNREGSHNPTTPTLSYDVG